MCVCECVCERETERERERGEVGLIPLHSMGNGESSFGYIQFGLHNLKRVLEIGCITT